MKCLSMNLENQKQNINLPILFLQKYVKKNWERIVRNKMQRDSLQIFVATFHYALAATQLNFVLTETLTW